MSIEKAREDANNFAVKAAGNRGVRHMDSKIRVGLDIGIVIFIISLSFQAGITYSELNGVKELARSNQGDIQQIEIKGDKTDERLATIEQILRDIQWDIQNKPKDKQP